MLIIPAFIGGLIAGTVLNLDNETVLAGGLLGAIAAPFSPWIGVATCGASLASLIKTIIKGKVQKVQVEEVQKVEEVLNIQEVEEEEEEEEEYSRYKALISALGLLGIPVVLLGLIPQLSTFILPVSILLIVGGAYVSLTSNDKSIGVKVLSIISTITIGIAAFCSLQGLGGLSGGAFIYFLTLVTIPKFILSFFNKNNNNNKDQDNNENREQALIPTLVSSLLYGSQTSESNKKATNTNLFVTMIGIISTILNGSQKDILGSLLNGDNSLYIEYYRPTLFAIFVSFLIIKFLLCKSGFKLPPLPFKFPKLPKIPAGILGGCMALLSGVYALTVLECAILPFIILSIIGIGIKYITKSQSNQIVINMLLIIGVLTSI